ncbi:MAG: class I SAM-dependent methyltransferase, partial [Candidatus Acidiferrales bacterium]
MSDDLEVISACKVCGAQDLEDIYPSSWVRQCRACGYVFRSTRATQEAISRFYSREGKYAHWLTELDARDPCFRYRLRRLRRFIPAGRLLDVGAGIGEFLHHAGRFFEVTGTEVSDEAVRLSREEFGIELLKGTLAEANLAAGSFDVVSLIHVLEHVQDPADTVACCKGLLRPGGWLFVAVPNDSPTGWYKLVGGARRTLRRLIRRNVSKISYRETPPFGSVDLRAVDTMAEIHLSHFSPESLHFLLSRSGFETVYVGPDPCYTTTGFNR